MFEGPFETHLTVASNCDDGALAGWAARNGAKYTRIVLDAGSTPDQPMLTTRGRGPLADALAAARIATERLATEVGARVVRVKVEASPFNPDVPHTTADAARSPAGCHFEHHVKVILDDAAHVATVTALAAPHGGHVSRNARRGPVDGRHERFVTQRCHRVGRDEAGRRLDALLAALRPVATVAEIEREYVVFDGRPDLDDGWIGGSPG